jgi:hypothetical protein
VLAGGASSVLWPPLPSSRSFRRPAISNTSGTVDRGHGPEPLKEQIGCFTTGPLPTPAPFLEPAAGALEGAVKRAMFGATATNAMLERTGKLEPPANAISSPSIRERVLEYRRKQYVAHDTPTLQRVRVSYL